MKIELHQIDRTTEKKLRMFLQWCYQHNFRLQQILEIGKLLFKEDKHTKRTLLSLSMEAFDAMYEGKKRMR